MTYTVLVLAQQEPVREITKITGDLYRFRNNVHYSVFLVTPAGIIATDPINAEAARWLKQEFIQRFNQSVKYLIYSHDHADHIAGGDVFADTAIVVAHENARTAIIRESRPTAVPQIVFSDRMIITLGGKLVELIYLGKNHSNNSIVLRFPEERALFAVDFIPVQAIAFRDFPDGYISDWIESLKKVETLDFDMLVPGHGPIGKKENVRMFRNYMEELFDEIFKYVREGKTLDEIKQLVKMEKYQDWFGYKEWFPLNIEGMVRYVQLYRRPNY
jgi:glyoxylase-like metal-dependent hydrolase (beta-lactamase superfamily II)